MTEVMDDSLSWEQRREMRRKKRQELLAEADRLVQNTEPVTSSSGLSRLARDRTEYDDDDEFEKERQRRRREREERRRREREELEQQLKEEEEQRAERDKRREERRRLREEAERPAAPVESFTSTTVVTKTVEVYDGQDNYEETTETVMEKTETVTEEPPPVENGRASVGSSDNDEVDVASERDEDEPEVTTITTTETITLTTETTSSYDDGNEEDANEVQEKLNALKMKRQQTSQKRYTSVDEDTSTPEDRQARMKELEEKRKRREQMEREEEERKRAEAAKREADYQEQLRIERENREKRRQEAEAKRQAYRKQLTESESTELASPLSPKVLTSPLVSKVEQLNKHISDSPKTSKSTPVANVGSLDSRLEKYTKQASKQDSKKASGVSARSINQDVSGRRNRWERGDVISSSEKPTAKKDLFATAGDISSRKNLWESGKVGGSSSFKSNRKADDVKGADFSSRKNLWLKATQQESTTKKSESPVAIRTGVSSRLNQWEKGEVGGNSPAEKGRAKSDLVSASGVVDRRAKWENIGSDSPKTTTQKTTVRVVTALSDRKNAFESKANPKDEDQPSSLDQAQYDPDDRSYSSQDDDVESDVDSYDD